MKIYEKYEKAKKKMRKKLLFQGCGIHESKAVEVGAGGYYSLQAFLQ